MLGYLREHGPTGTRGLMAKLTDGSRPMKNAVEKGLDQLDQAMLIAKVGTEGGNSIAHVWDLCSPSANRGGQDHPLPG